MNKLFVPKEIARLLKEKGFDFQCMACYDKLDMLSTYSESIFVTKNYNTSGYVCSAPLYQQVIDWFRSVHKIKIIESQYFSDTKDFWYVKHYQDIVEYDSLDQAIEGALKLI